MLSNKKKEKNIFVSLECILSFFSLLAVTSFSNKGSPRIRKIHKSHAVVGNYGTLSVPGFRATEREKVQ